MKTRKVRIVEFVQNCLGDYKDLLQWTISVNDESGDYTDFEVTITNTTNDNHVHPVLRCYDYEGGIDIHRGEDTYSTDEKDFIMELFLTKFLTFVEV